MKAKIFPIDNHINLYKDIINQINLKRNPDDWLSFSHDKITIKKFSDGELTVQFDEYIRGHKVFLLCSTDSSDNIIKLALAADAAKRASASEVIAIIPYFGYARQDRKDGLRGAVGAKVMANTLVANGIDRIITIDLHADQIQGFFNIPVDHISSWNIFLPVIKNMYENSQLWNLTLCSPDAGGVKRVNTIFKKLINDEYDNTTMAIFSKMRDKPNQVERFDLIGDVKDRDVIIIDDIIDTGGTLCGTAQIIKDAGANSVRAMITHGILSGDALNKISNSCIEELIITDTRDKYLKKNNKIKIITSSVEIARMIEANISQESANQLKSKYITNM